MTETDRILAALAGGPITSRELAAAVGLEDHRDTLDPLAELGRAGLTQVARGHGPATLPGTTILYELTRAGALEARENGAAIIEPPAPAKRAPWTDRRPGELYADPDARSQSRPHPAAEDFDTFVRITGGGLPQTELF